MPALAVLLAAAVNVYDFGTMSASVPRWCVIYLWAGVVVWSQRRFDPVDRAALALLLWFALSLLWSQDWQQGVYEFTNASALCAIFMWVRRNPRWIGEAAMLSVVVALILQCLFPLDWGGHGNRNFQTETMLIAMALGLEARTKFALPAWIALATVVAWYLAFINPSKIEFVVALFLVAALVWRKRNILRPVPG